MRRFRFSIAWLMAVVVLVAANCAAFRSILNASNAATSLFGFGVLPMADVLLIGLVVALRKARRRGGWSPFWKGFEAAGLLAMLGYAVVSLVASDLLMQYVDAAFVPLVFVANRLGIDALEGATKEILSVVLEIGTGTLILLAPQVAIAGAGGWLARRYGLVRRGTPSRRESTGEPGPLRWPRRADPRRNGARPVAYRIPGIEP